MARRTKQAAQATRDHILDTAERVFQRRGVSRTTLGEIAQQAGLTRGAIYWHFEDKAALFDAMVERVTLPMEQSLAGSVNTSATEPLAPLRASLAAALRRMVDDPQVRRVVDIVTHKVEYIDELPLLRSRHIDGRERCLRDIERILRQARAAGLLAPKLHLKRAAVGLHALVDGLIQNWMLDPGAFDLAATGRQAMDAYLAGLASPGV